MKAASRWARKAMTAMTDASTTGAMPAAAGLMSPALIAAR